MTAVKYLILIALGLGSGIVISGAVYAFIAVIGVVPRLAGRTGTGRYVKVYEEAIIFGGILGALAMLTHPYIPIGRFGVMLFGLLVGIFYGCLAVSLAEVLDVLPVLARRMRLRQGLKWFITALALGKLLGSVLYYFVSGFNYV
jgi:stage V sporulation protein AB